MKERLLKYLHRAYRKDEYVNSFLAGVKAVYENFNCSLIRISNLLHFNRLDVSGCEWWERQCAIKNIYSTLADRVSLIRARWLANAHNDIKLIQSVCNSWKNGEVEAGFVDGKLQIKFVGEYGIPENLRALLDEIENIKPAHLGYLILFKYLLIEDIHEVKTIEEMEMLTIDKFAFGEGE